MASMVGRCIGSGGLVASLVVACGGRTGLSGSSEAGTAVVCDADCNEAGSEQHVFVNSDTTLYDVAVPSGVVKTIGDTGVHLTDTALSPQNVLYGVSLEGLSKVTPSSGYTSVVLKFDGYKIAGADFAPDGTLFLCGGSLLLILDQQKVTYTTVAQAPSPWQLAGDLAFIGSRLLVTASSGEGSDELFAFDVTSGTSTLVGSIGFSCVWGLAPVGASLFGFTCEGRILSIDPQTGAGTEITRIPSITFWGAASR